MSETFRPKFQSLEELQEKYPIGTKLNIRETVNYDVRIYFNEKDLEFYRKNYENVEIQSKDTVLIKTKDIRYDTVEGYLFDGEYWYPAQSSWDGWLEIDIYEDNK